LIIFGGHLISERGWTVGGAARAIGARSAASPASCACRILERLLQAGKPRGLTAGSGEMLFPPAKAIVYPRSPLARQR
jgi:hypothetical protein